MSVNWLILANALWRPCFGSSVLELDWPESSAISPLAFWKCWPSLNIRTVLDACPVAMVRFELEPA